MKSATKTDKVTLGGRLNVNYYIIFFPVTQNTAKVCLLLRMMTREDIISYILALRFNQSTVSTGIPHLMTHSLIQLGYQTLLLRASFALHHNSCHQYWFNCEQYPANNAIPDNNAP